MTMFFPNEAKNIKANKIAKKLFHIELKSWPEKRHSRSSEISERGSSQKSFFKSDTVSVLIAPATHLCWEEHQRQSRTCCRHEWHDFWPKHSDTAGPASRAHADPTNP
mmetsp:Transcript_28478/g.69457  ORF Transcript_28478/g.69457 Transcript_28478/m.69457 type:complete len:108 (+) Transcript_28478:1003-1326(+)